MANHTLLVFLCALIAPGLVSAGRQRESEDDEDFLDTLDENASSWAPEAPAGEAIQDRIRKYRSSIGEEEPTSPRTRNRLEKPRSASTRSPVERKQKTRSFVSSLNRDKDDLIRDFEPRLRPSKLRDLDEPTHLGSDEPMLEDDDWASSVIRSREVSDQPWARAGDDDDDDGGGEAPVPVASVDTTPIHPGVEKWLKINKLKEQVAAEKWLSQMGTKQSFEGTRTLEEKETPKWVQDQQLKEDMAQAHLEELARADAEAKKLQVETLQRDLKNLIGLENVKEEVARLLRALEFDAEREQLGMKSLGGQSLHMAFLGNPGTGKTVVARIVGQLMEAFGVVKKSGDKSQGDKRQPEKCDTSCIFDARARGWGKACGVEKCSACSKCAEYKAKDPEAEEFIFKEVSRADLVAEHVGHTAPKVMNAVNSALGGVLFIDEAYAIKRDDRDSFGQEAIDTLIKAMEDHRSELIVIFAGYDKEMMNFFQLNPGLRSRVPFTFNFEDYTCDQLMKIGELQMRSQHVRLSFSEEHYDSPCFPQEGS
jgi:SpoVK/Ycf46/Vps4 family AAA+-type ATPase